MDHSTIINVYIFVFTFCCGYVFAGKRAILKLSTRVALVVLFLCGLVYLTAPPGTLRDVATVATLLCNVLFLAFAASDYVDWLRERADAR